MNLQMSLKKQWFEMTKAGIKTEDYREITPYWVKRLFHTEKLTNWFVNDFVREFSYHGDELGFIEKFGKHFVTNTMTLGYPLKTDTARILKFKHEGIEIRTGVSEWGAEPNKLYFVIKHGERII